jgi:hypothetical protein
VPSSWRATAVSGRLWRLWPATFQGSTRPDERLLSAFGPRSGRLRSVQPLSFVGGRKGAGAAGHAVGTAREVRIQVARPAAVR